MSKALILAVYKDPSIVKTFTNKEWNGIRLQAKSGQIMLQFLDLLKSSGYVEYMPKRLLTTFENEQYKIEHQRIQVINEVNQLNKTLKAADIQATYLKGAAYLLADLPLAKHRLFSDIDILVSKNEIKAAEKACLLIGFISQKTDDYDQEYYRRYMHEIPPMQHVLRGTALDIHHNILPTCNEHPVDISMLNSNPVSDVLNTQSTVFNPAAMFLHSAVHLFHESEFDKGLRDLTDLASMYADFSKKSATFLNDLFTLSEKTQLNKPVYFALRYINKVLAVELSDQAKDFMTTIKPSITFPRLMDFVFINVFVPYHKSCHTWQTHGAQFIAYWRGHLLRMPLKLLVPHLAKKSMMAITDALNGQKNSLKEQPKL